MSALIRALPVGALVAATACWGSVVILVKVAVHGVPIITITIVELLLTVLALGVVQAVRRTPIRRPHRGLLIAGLLEPGLAYPMINVGLEHTSGSHSAIIIGTESVFVVAGTAALQRTRPKPRVVIALALTVVGAALLSDSHGGHASIGGDLLVAGGVVLAAGYVLLAQRYPAEQDAVAATFVQFAMGGVVVVPLVLFAVARAPHLDTLWRHPTPGQIAATVAVGLLGSAGGFVLYNWGLPRVNAAVAATSLGLIPLFGIAASKIFLDEPVTPVVFAAMVAVVAGVVLTARNDPAEALAAHSEPLAKFDDRTIGPAPR